MLLFSCQNVSDSLWLQPAAPWIAACQASLSHISRSVPKFMSTDSVMPSNLLITVNPFSFWAQSFPASESFPVSRLFALGGQIIGASALATILPMNIQGWFPLGLTGFISLLTGMTWKEKSQRGGYLRIVRRNNWVQIQEWYLCPQMCLYQCTK